MGNKGYRWIRVIGGVAAVATALSCVGSESGSGRADEGDDPSATRAETTQGATGGVDYDTVPAADYQVFETVVESERPRKLTVRLLLGGSMSRMSTAKTLRVVLDSISRADTAVVATRAILYTTRPESAIEAEVEPVAFALWVPPEGWEGASEGSRERLHRTFVYHGVPDWPVPPRESDAGEGSDE